MKYLWMLMISLFFAMSVLAVKGDDEESTQRFPTGCYPQGFADHYRVLYLYPHQDGNTQSMYFIHNLDSNTITLRQMRTGDEPFMLNLNNEIKPGKWGVFAGRAKTIKFICTKEKKGRTYGEVVDCSEVLDVCEYPNVEFSIINYGSYWVTESASMRSAQREATRKGAILQGRKRS